MNDSMPRSTPIGRTLTRERTTTSLQIVSYLCVGVIQTLLAFAIFERTDDHLFFLDLANNGLSTVPETGALAYDIKAQIAGAVFHALTAPSRWLSAGELGHLIWLRLMTLGGFLLAFEWIRNIVPRREQPTDIGLARRKFMVLCLLYPGQLAWTASLMRDGPSCTFLFGALFAWSMRHHVLALVSGALCLALRPEFLVIAAMLAIGQYLVVRFKPRKYRILIVMALCILISMVLFEPRWVASEFAQAVFAEDGFAYPFITNRLDWAGFSAVLMQALMDPISLASLTSLTRPSLFSIAEVTFFFSLMLVGVGRLRAAGIQIAGIFIGLFASLWIFAYFEVFIGGFSRHRMGLLIVLIALTLLTRPKPRPRPRPHSSSTPTPTPTQHPSSQPICPHGYANPVCPQATLA